MQTKITIDAINSKVFDINGDYLFNFESYDNYRDNCVSPVDIAVSNDRVYVLDQSIHPIKVFDRYGNLISQLGIKGDGKEEISDPGGIAVDERGFIYITDSDVDKGCVMIFNNKGEFIKKFGSTGYGNYKFWYPNGIFVDREKNIYVVDDGGCQIKVYDRSCRYIRSIGSQGSMLGYLLRPAGVYVDSNKNIYVADKFNCRIEVFNSDGEAYMQIGHKLLGKGQFARPLYLDFREKLDKFYVSDHYTMRIYSFYDNGKPIDSFGGYGKWTGQEKGCIAWPWGVFVDANENIWVTSASYYGWAGKVIVFNSRGEEINRFGPPGSGNGELQGPGGIFAYNDKIYVADSGNRRIEIFTPEGKYVSQIENVGSDDLRDIFVYSDKIYLVNTGINAIQIFDIDGNLIKTIPINYPRGIFVDSEEKIWVTSGDVNTSPISVFDKNGNLIYSYGKRGGPLSTKIAHLSKEDYQKNPGYFLDPSGIRVINNYCYVVDSGNARIQKIPIELIFSGGKEETPLKLLNIYTCKKIEDDNPSEITRNFSLDDSRVYIWLEFKVEKDCSFNRKFRWYDPKGNLYYETLGVDKNLKAGWVYKAYSWLSISSTDMKNLKGWWTVVMVIDGKEILETKYHFYVLEVVDEWNGYDKRMDLNEVKWVYTLGNDVKECKDPKDVGIDKYGYLYADIHRSLFDNLNSFWWNAYTLHKGSVMDRAPDGEDWMRWNGYSESKVSDSIDSSISPEQDITEALIYPSSLNNEFIRFKIKIRGNYSKEEDNYYAFEISENDKYYYVFISYDTYQKRWSANIQNVDGYKFPLENYYDILYSNVEKEDSDTLKLTMKLGGNLPTYFSNYKFMPRYKWIFDIDDNFSTGRIGTGIEMHVRVQFNKSENKWEGIIYPNDYSSWEYVDSCSVVGNTITVHVNINKLKIRGRSIFKWNSYSYIHVTPNPSFPCYEYYSIIDKVPAFWTFVRVKLSEIDSTPPEIYLKTQVPKFINKNTFSIIFDVSDNESPYNKIKVFVNLNNSGWRETEDKIFYLNELPDGKYTILAKAVDEAKNKSNVLRIEFILDTTPPEISVYIPETVYESFLTISGVVKDNLSGINYLKVNNHLVSVNQNGNFKYTAFLLEGNNSIYIEVVDKAGNIVNLYRPIKYIKRTTIRLQIGSKTMYVNDIPLEIDVPPTIVEGRTLLPIRWVAEPLGAGVSWDGKEKKVTVSLGDVFIELWIGKSVAKVNGKFVYIDPNNSKVVPMIINGRTMIPVRFVAENLGCRVEWDPTTRIVTIIYPKD